MSGWRSRPGRGRRPAAGRCDRDTTRALPETVGGVAVDLVDPSGIPVRVVAGTHQLRALPSQTAHIFNFGHDCARINATQRPPREPARVQRLGHVVLQTTKYTEALNWYLDNLGMIVSDFLYFPGQRERGPTMSFIRCDRGTTPTDHHTLAMVLGPPTVTCTPLIRSATWTRSPRAASSWRARLPAVLGHRPAHPGQPDLRLLA